MKFKKLKQVLFLCSLTAGLSAQYVERSEERIKGKVLDPEGNPVVGAKVVVKGGSQRMVGSNMDGDFSILIDRKTDSIFSISSMGYQGKEIKLKPNQMELKIELKDGLDISDVEIVGYEVRTKEEMKGSITTVSGKDAAKQVSTNILSGIQGKVAGVDIRTMGGAYAGQLPTIVIRGLSSFTGDATKPLYVIDGVAGADLESVNQQDIEYMEILKDAEATSLYGSRGGAGVIIIKTKRGAEDKNTTDFTYSNSFQIIHMNKFHDPVEVARATEKPNGLFPNVSNGIAAWADEKLKDPTYKTMSLYWTDENGKTYKPQDVFQTGLVQQHNLSVSGNQMNTSYYLGGSLINQKSALKGETYDKYNLKLSLGQKLHEKVQLTLGATAYLSDLNRKYHPWLYYLLTKADDATEIAKRLYNRGYTSMDPFKLQEMQKYTATKKGIQSNLELKVELLKNFYSSTILSGYYHDESRHRVWGADYYDAFHDIKTGGENNKKGHTLFSYQIEEVLNYFKGFVDNRLTLSTLGRFNFTHRQKNYFEYNGTQLANAPDFSEFGNVGKPDRLNSYIRYRSIMQYNGRVGLDWEKKYAFAVGFAGDVSSSMPEGNKHALFPTTSLSWNIKNESFLKRDKVISSLKWKAAWGMSANSEAVLDTYYDQLYISSGSYLDNVGFYTTNIKINPNLKWEKVNSTNTGIEIGLFDRLNINIEYYYKRTNDAIYTTYQGLTVADGYSARVDNIGNIQNQGVELNIRAITIAYSNFNWNVGYTATYNKNKVLKINDPSKYVGGPGYGGYFGHREGQEMGMLRLKDGREYRINPNFYGSINNEFNFFNVDISMMIAYSSGGNIFLDAYAEQAADPSKYVQSTDFIRLREVSIGYTLPNHIMKKIKGKSLRIFVQGGNLFTWVKGKNVVDPEISAADREFETSVSNPFYAGFDDAYPANPMTFTAGLSLKF